MFHSFMPRMLLRCYYRYLLLLQEFGVQYSTVPTFWDAMRKHVLYLRAITEGSFPEGYGNVWVTDRGDRGGSNSSANCNGNGSGSMCKGVGKASFDTLRTLDQVDDSTVVIAESMGLIQKKNA
jgi:hypothetical protein